ncbi:MULTISPECIES: phage tail tape measure protein [Bacillus amyloliquefaciens group]|uniref:phage tail tape measure protein n=1 Tax=Bacillus amyloliquefaciens group TaxID=1938374 RepID=UPI00227DB2CA|nr:phage tail tape measure protein [Bacillus velezensis]MCY7442877.1 phage tail tape measure protein [Bacillus velezensis]
MSNEVLGNMITRLSFDDNGFSQGVDNIKEKMALVRSEMKASSSQFGRLGDASDKLRERQEGLSKLYQLQSNKIEQMRNKYQELAREKGENSKVALQLAQQINNEVAAYNYLGRQLEQTTLEINTQNSAWTKAGNSLKDYSERLEKQGDRLKTLGKVGVAGITAPVAALGVMALKSAGDVKKAQGSIQAQMGLTKEEAEKATKAATNIWKEGFGENVGEVTNVLSNVRRNIKSLGDASNDTIQRVTQSTMTIAEAFDQEGNDITKSINAMQNSFDNLSVDQSMDMITSGFQKGLDYSGEFLDSINEYSNQFSAAGFSVEQMFSIFEAGAETGAFQLDKVGDLVKEMNIRLSDGSAGDAIKTLSKHTQNLYAEFKKTGKGGDQVFTAIMKDIDGMSNKSKAYQAGQAIMGTQFEDLGQKGVSALANVKNSFSDVEGATKKTGAALRDNLNDRAAKAFRELQTNLIPVGEILMDKLEPALKKTGEVIGDFTEWFHNLSPSMQNTVVIAGLLAAAFPPIVIALGAVVSSVGKLVGAAGRGAAALGRFRAETALTRTSTAQLAAANVAATTKMNVSTAAVGRSTRSLRGLRGGAVAAGGAMAMFGGKWGNVLGIATMFLPEILKGGAGLLGFGKKALVAAGGMLGFGSKAQAAGKAASTLTGGVAQTAGRFGGLGVKALGLVKNIGSVARVAGVARLGFAALGGPIGLTITGVSLLAEGGYKLYKHLQKEQIPALDSFGNKVSDTTTKAVLGYKNLNEKATAQLNQLNWSGQKISKEAANSIVKNFDQMGDQIKTSIQTKGDQSYKSLSAFLSTSKSLSKKEQQAILENVRKKQDEQKGAVSKGQEQIKQIMNKASSEKRQLTQKEKSTINSIQKSMMTTAVKTMSKSEVEQKAILGKLRNESKNITARQAADTIKNSIKARDGAVKAANSKYNKTVAAIIRERDETGSISNAQADKMIKEAKRQRDDSVKATKSMHKKVVSEAKKQAGEHADEIDTETGSVKSGWDMMMDKVGDAWDWIKGIFSGGEKKSKPKTKKKSAPKTAGRSLGGAQIGAYAKGTPSSGHPGGLAITSEKGRELIHEPGIGTYLSGNSGPELRNLRPGTSVLPNKQTERILKSHGFPGYEGGVGKYFDWIMKGADFLWEKASGMFGIADSLVPSWFTKISGSPLKAVGNLAIKGIDSLMGSIGSFVGEGGSAAVKKWVAQALAIKGLGSQFASALETIAMKESGGNPNVVNGWDSNAKAGHPSQGLMQFIPSTFNAHKEPGHGNIKNPVDQILAAINYLNSRYGGIFNHPGLVSMARGGPYIGYAAGGVSPGAGGTKFAALNERGYDEHIITTDPKYRERSIGIWARAGQELGVPAQSVPQVPSLEPVTARQDRQIALLEEQNAYLAEIASKNPDIYLDTKKVGKVLDARSTQTMNNRLFATGGTN